MSLFERTNIFCEFPERLLGPLTKPEFRPRVVFKEEVVEWAAENLRGAYKLTCIGHELPGDPMDYRFDGGGIIIYDYYLSFEDEVDMLMFKMKWFDAERE